MSPGQRVLLWLHSLLLYSLYIYAACFLITWCWFGYSILFPTGLLPYESQDFYMFYSLLCPQCLDQSLIHNRQFIKNLLSKWMKRLYHEDCYMIIIYLFFVIFIQTVVFISSEKFLRILRHHLSYHWHQLL